jgi:4-amino-4-deoxy-L-arabinose transferase-like glycosyltransferase
MRRLARRVLFDSSEWTWVLLAAALRCALAAKAGNAFLQADEHGYTELARQLATSGLVGTHGLATAGAPVPAALIALSFKLFGPSLAAARLATAVVGTFAAWALGRAAAALTGSRPAGRVALAVAAVYPFFAYYSVLLMTETPYLALTIPALALIGLAARKESPRYAAAGGLLLGLAALTRAEAAPIGALVFAAAAFVRPSARARRVVALAALCWLLPILAWCARNRLLVGAFTLDTHGGMTLLHGTMLHDDNEIDTKVAQTGFDATPLGQEAARLPEVERDRLLKRAAVGWMFSHPGRTAELWLLKLGAFWRPWPRVDKTYQNDADANPSGGVGRGWLVAVSLATEPLLIVAGFAGLWALRERRETWPQWAFLIGTMGVHVVSVSQMRYRLPVMPALILGASFLLARALQSETR